MIDAILIGLAVLIASALSFYSGGTIGKNFIRRGNNYLLRKCRRIFGCKAVANPIFPIVTDSQKADIGSAIKLSFIGDLILLREAVERARQDDKVYDFVPMFKYVKPYFDSSDYVFGVFEGPVAGYKRPFSTSNRGDGIPLHNNFPDSYVEAIRGAGVDFVTTANNHLLDCGVDGAMRTLDVLDAFGIEHTGSYRSKEEYDAVKIVEVKGKRIAVLAYTYGSEYCDEDYFFKKNPCVTRLLVPKKSPYFNRCKQMVRADFAAVKACQPDLIVVMPHMGAEFSHSPDKTQVFWARYYVELGADIVFADHPHAVQPIEWMRSNSGHNAVIVYCPGNYINCYTQNDGDASMIAEVYLDPVSCRPFATSIVPVFTYGRNDANYVGVPVYDFMNNPEFGADKISISDLKRCAEVNQLVVKAALGVSLTIDQVQDRYYYFYGQGYCRQPVNGFARCDLPEHSVLIDAIEANDSICFIGDSVTEGTRNGGYGWFEPLMRAFTDKQVVRIVNSGQGIKYFGDHIDEIIATGAMLYVFAVGCYDVLCRDGSVCAITADEYVTMARWIVEKIRSRNSAARFVFIAPWESAVFDPWHDFNVQGKRARYRQYESSLIRFCEQNACAFVNPNPYIQNALIRLRPFATLKDALHPNAADGIRLFSKACAEYK